mgnify:CR=1 FL=1
MSQERKLRLMNWNSAKGYGFVMLKSERIFVDHRVITNYGEATKPDLDGSQINFSLDDVTVVPKMVLDPKLGKKVKTMVKSLKRATLLGVS